MKKSDRLLLTAALLITTLQIVALRERSAAQAAPVAPCDLRLRVELTPDVPYPRDAGFVSSLLGNHLDYQLTLLRQDPEDSSVITLDLSGPGPVAGCGEVVSSLRRDARVASVEVQPVAARAALPVISPVPAPGDQPVSNAQPMGTLQAGPDGDWVLKRSSDVPYAEQARVRYECDISAVDQTGFDPTADDGGVPPDEITGKRADYLRAEAACFQARLYREVGSASAAAQPALPGRQGGLRGLSAITLKRHATGDFDALGIDPAVILGNE